jgi:hypothetical protein
VVASTFETQTMQVTRRIPEATPRRGSRKVRLRSSRVGRLCPPFCVSWLPARRRRPRSSSCCSIWPEKLRWAWIRGRRAAVPHNGCSTLARLAYRPATEKEMTVGFARGMLIQEHRCPKPHGRRLRH